MNEPIFNLSALAERLLREGRKTDFARKIISAVDISSVEADLQFAQEACDALKELLATPMRSSAISREATQAALLSHIILLYVRATKTQSSTRRGYDLRSKLTADEKEVHLELCDLRDKAIAHYGDGGSYRGPWVVELAVADFAGPKARSAIFTRRMGVDVDLLKRAQKQIRRALEIIGKVRQERMNALTDAFNAESLADSQFFKELVQYPVNVELLLGGPEQVARMKAARDNGGRARSGFGVP